MSKPSIMQAALARIETKRESERVNNPKRYAARLRAETRARQTCPVRRFQDRFYQPIVSELATLKDRLGEIRTTIQTNSVKAAEGCKMRMTVTNTRTNQRIPATCRAQIRRSILLRDRLVCIIPRLFNLRRDDAL